uniref:Uncharacterized protein n=1 Tax=viral metagenome TaxID=1070528 RepID=A0A6M3LZQ1_9ZZZZ
MADENKSVDTDESTEEKLNPETLLKTVRQLREEAKRHRLKAEGYAAELEPLKNKASEYEAQQAKILEEQGKYKELYENAQKEIERKNELEKRLSAIDKTFAEELDSLKKGLSEDDIKIIDDLSVPVEQKLRLARTMTGKRTVSNDLPDARPGGSNFGGADALLKEYGETTNDQRKTEILFDLERHFPKVYEKFMQ